MRYLSFLLLTLLVGCATTPAPPPAGTAPWQERLERLSTLQSWQAQGKLALRNGAAAESANLLWRQQDGRSELQLSGPLGVAATQILAEGERLEVRRGEELRILDISTPQAVELSTGWDLPLKALPYWMLGIPQPGAEATDLAFENERLTTLSQDGWQVSFDAYGQFGGYTLPTRLRVSRGETSARLFVRDWQPGSEP
ncbi:outer membrane lipoprotein LolB [Parahaliea maris]|uniref:Outer-membrane lipoprotein LolB n=1 Tax=Parahaliea maris TaxID=2716870 RepID=A0A5C9A6C1_9GAMM|nr:lipoprotein insertase outer membrane protein LolB [Parahaliea maris]TXS96388.1 outer membrane lipoprotein LolB [Parahaliea maris]